MEKCRIRLRGWDYPHVDRSDSRENGANWIASGVAWGRYNEYWKLFQSGQFVHLFTLLDSSEPDAVRTAIEAAKPTMPSGDDPNAVKGAVNILGLLYTMTEIHAFASGLVAEGVYTGSVKIEIQLVNAANFILTTDILRHWGLFCPNTQNLLGKEWVYPAETLMSSAGSKALDATSWFLQRFGWLTPNIEQLQRDQDKLLRREF